MEQQRNWVYRNLQIEEGLKPESTHFQYFFVVSQGGKKKCNYCVWIDDDAVDCFTNSGCYEDIVKSKREEWSKWVQSKIDKKDFRNLVLKINSTGQKELNLKEMKEKMIFE